MGLYRQQKHAARIIYYKDKLTHSKPLFKNMNALGVHELNIFQTLMFMFKDIDRSFMPKNGKISFFMLLYVKQNSLSIDILTI